MTNYDVAVIGGGLTGLTVAYELCKAGRKVVVLEKKNELGGMLSSIKIKDYQIEKYYHHVFSDYKTNFIWLMEDLGIANTINWVESHIAFIDRDKFFRLSTLIDLFTFKKLRLMDRLKLAFLTLKIKLIKDSKKFDNISAKNWIIENSNKNIYEKLFRPLLRGKYGETIDDVSAAWFIDRIKLRSNRGFRGESLGYVRGGFQNIIERLAKEIERNGGKIETNSNIEEIKLKDKRILHIKSNGKKIKTDCVISTIPPELISKIANFPKTYKEKLRLLEYQGVLCILMGLEKKLTDFYWTNVMHDCLFGAFIEHTNFQPYSLYNDHIIYLASYPNKNSYLWKADEKQIFEKYFKELTKIFPNLSKKDVKWWRMFKDKNAGLIYKRGISSHIPHYKTPIEGFYICGMFNSYPDRNIETSIRMARECANLIRGHKCLH